MADNFSVKLEGVEQLKLTLESMPKKIRDKVVRSALRRAALIISKDAKARAPVLSAENQARQGLGRRERRRPGTVKRRISVRPSKFARRAGDEGVFIGVKPLQKNERHLGKRSARNPNDPFYWWYLEFGTRKMRKRPFLMPAASAKGEQAIQQFLRETVPAIERMNKPRGGG